ncbi:MAG TPA: molybdopterin cofactor-binding domain-containing protein [Thermoanaerobaculia bacterium]
MSPVPAFDRRTFLKVGATAAGGLLVGVWRVRASPESAAGGRPLALGAFVEIKPDGTVVVFSPRPEVGSGVKTSLAMLIAEELGVDWKNVTVRQPEMLDPKYLDQFTGGSAGISDSWDPLRKAGAAAREVLVAAAAEKWQVPPGECRSENGAVLHPASGRRLDYRELVERAAELKPPESPALKSTNEFRIAEKATATVDLAEIVTGRITYGLDVRLPGMLHAVVERSPVFGGKVAKFDASRALSVPGVRKVVELPADRFALKSGRPIMVANGVAVIATSTWAAMKGRKALRVEWDEGPHAAESSAALRARLEKLASGTPGKILRDDGNVDTALASAAKTLEAVYEVPFVEAAPLEPVNCTARVKDGACELWAPTQNPYNARSFAATALGLQEDSWNSAITVHMVRPGGGFGRRLDTDYAAEAAYLAAQVPGEAVQVMSTRGDEIAHSLYRSGGYHRMRAGLDASGSLVAWFHHLANCSRYRYQHGESPPWDSEISQDDFPAGHVANFRVGYSEAESPIPRGYYRSMVPGATNFALECFLDEIARAAGRDPLAFRLALIGEGRVILYANYGGPQLDTARLRRVLELAAAKGDWGRPVAKGRGRGIAGGFVFGSYSAAVAEVSIARDRSVRVHRVVSAVDCGRVINPSGAAKQIEGAVNDALNLALKLEITFDKGRVVQKNFTDYPPVRMRESPKHIESHLVASDKPPTGLGEIPVPPAISAIANAVSAITGKRVRKLPIRLA